ncbi:DUF445 domain-containing protein [Escherichia coli]|uniref:DUF445 domain-containing protein n=1 Tax=Escherichia coli TaxID=562 RepID=UPI000BE19C51|nr:DUF445 family protein [Escherichia coli]EFN8112134.1 DUF445 family protein [Escherichia coli]
MNKLIELRRAKMLALSLLLIAAATFVVTLFLPPNFWVSGVKAIAEAAMVGALADWFAVVALFRRVPIPIISRHTAIIPRNKDRIGENLGQFVQEKFLDTLIAQLIALLQRDKSRKFIAQQIVRWLESEHPLKAKILPTEWLGEHSAELVSDAVNSLLDDISRDRAHQIRHAFDRATFALIEKLKNDPEMAARADAVKSYLKEDEAFNRYLSELWGDLREWLKADINSEDSRVKERIARAGQWFGETLIADDALRASLNGHLEQAAHRVAPEFSAFLTRHISDTVKSWDARDMSRQIELNIGKDLQFIRVNGTLVGGCIGLILYLLSQLPALFPLGNL